MRNTVNKNRRKHGHFTTVSNNAIRDMELSNGAFRMLCLMLADSDIYVPYLWKLQEIMNINEKTARKYMNELIEKKYVNRIPIQSGYRYEIFECPEDNTEFHGSQKGTGVTFWDPTKQQVLTQY